MLQDFSGKKWEVTVQTQAEAAHSQVTAKVDAAALKEQADRQKVLDALNKHGGREGITLSKLMDHISNAPAECPAASGSFVGIEASGDMRRIQGRQ